MSVERADELTRVLTYTEWDPLREVIVGSATNARIPTVKDHGLRSVDYAHLTDEQFEKIRTGPYPLRIVEETNEDLERFVEILSGLGIRVHRPAVPGFSGSCHGYCPRDSILTIGDRAIGTPMALRHRRREAQLYSHVVETFRAPEPRLLDSMYDRSILGVPTLQNHEPVFDAANCLKLGRDILFLVSNTGNQAGADWLQEHLGTAHRIHPVRDVYSFVHIDSTIVPLRPGLVLLCPDRVHGANVPAFFEKWDKIYAPEPEESPYEPGWNPSSKWIAINCLSLSPELTVVEERQTSLMRLLARHRIESQPVRLRHMRTLGGGPHCVTLDLVRDGSLEDYS